MIQHLPNWAKNLFGLLRTIPRNARLTVLSTLRSVIEIIEQEWKDCAPPVAHVTEPFTHEFNHEPPTDPGMASTDSPVLPWKKAKVHRDTCQQSPPGNAICTANVGHHPPTPKRHRHGHQTWRGMTHCGNTRRTRSFGPFPQMEQHSNKDPQPYSNWPAPPGSWRIRFQSMSSPWV